VRGFGLTILAALLLLASVPASAQGALAPPAIHEPFTVLPCPAHPSSTLALEGCGEKALLRSDRAIDARARRIFKLLQGVARGTFVRSERAWLSYRRASCEAESSFYAGGSGQPLVYVQCEQGRNTTHLGDLAELLRTLSQH